MGLSLIALIALCLTVATIPPRWDLAILIKEQQMRPVPSKKFWRGFRNAIIPTLLLWAAIAFVIWLIIK